MSDQTQDGASRQRRTTFSQNSRYRRESFEIEDRRWSRPRQVRDWLRLLLLIGVSVGWMLLDYLREPGLR